MKFFRREVKIIKDYLTDDFTIEYICTEVKNGNMTIENFDKLEEIDRSILLKSIEVVYHDSHG